MMATSICLQCGDYSSYTDHVYAKANYINQTDAYILNDLFTTNYPQINATTYVTPLNTLTTFQINRKKLREILDYLAGLANADWYIDANGISIIFRFPIILRLLGSQIARIL